MNRSTLRRVVLFAVLVLCGWVVQTQTQKPARPLRLEKVKDDLYMVGGEGGNVALYVTSEGVILVDDMFDRNHDDIMAQIKSVTDKPLRYVLNTHQHDDHAGGDYKMLPIAEVIAHKNARANLVAHREPYYEDTPGTPIGLPRITFSDETAVHLGGREVRATFYGRGHTNGDVVVYFPALKVIHTGDLFLGRAAGGAGRAGRTGGAAAGGTTPPATPAPQRPPGVGVFVDYSQGGSFLEWSATLERLLTIDFDVAIPGHGPVSTKADIVKFRADLDTMRNRLQGLVKQGKTKDEMAGILETDYGWRARGCPPSPPTGGCLQFQQEDALIAELKK
jgi:glyoxylase-like metal-dependent hydrolase (beta-lactamase superfamily II)